MKFGKKRLWGLLAIIGIVGGLTGCGKSREQPRDRITRIMGISIPEEGEILYSFVGDTFSGRAPQYTIFTFESEPTTFLETEFYIQLVIKPEYPITFNSEKLKDYYEKDIIDRLLRYKIPDNYFPDFQEEYMSLFHRDNVLLYFKESKWLIYENMGY